jgi:hypothetical protein
MRLTRGGLRRVRQRRGRPRRRRLRVAAGALLGQHAVDLFAQRGEAEFELAARADGEQLAALVVAEQLAVDAGHEGEPAAAQAQQRDDGEQGEVVFSHQAGGALGRRGRALPASQASTSWKRRRRTSTSQLAGDAATLAASHRAVWLPGRPEGSGRLSKTALVEAAVSAPLWSTAGRR